MKDSLLSQIYIDYLLSDQNVSMIEVWDSRLFIWRYKGRPSIQTKLSLTFNLPIYYRPNDYKKLSKKYHPDLSSSKSPRVLSGDIQCLINNSKQVLEVQARGYNADDYKWGYSQFNRIVSCKTASTRSDLTRELSSRLYDRARLVQDRFSVDSESFTSLLQMSLKTQVRGQNLKDAIADILGEAKESNRAREVRKFNKPYPGTHKKKSNYTIYGASPRYEQRRLRQSHGDVFAVYIGGPCDTSPL